MGETPATTVALQMNALLKAQAPTPIVPVTLDIVSLPETLFSTTRPLAINGSLIGSLEGTENIAVRTAFGQITLSLTNLQSEPLKVLSNVLKNTNGLSPTVDVQIDSGNPPKKLTIALPEKWAQAPEMQAKQELPSAQNLTQSLSIKPRPASIAQGATVIATVLNPEHIQTNQPSFTAEGKSDFSQQEMPPHGIENPQRDNLQIETKNSITDPIKVNAQLPKEAQNHPTAPRPQLTLNLHIEAVVENEGQASTLQTANATIVAKGTAAQPIIEQDGLMLFVHEPTHLPVGTKLLVRTMPVTDDPVLARTEIDNTVTALQDLVTAMEESESLSSKPSPSLHIPSPQSHFAGTVLFFLSALQSGNIEEWLGGILPDKSIKGSKSHFKEKVIEALESATMAKALDATVGTWQSYPIPVYNDQAMEMMQLYVHRDGRGSGQQDNETTKAKATRFVVNVTMSRLGPIQLDGLSQPQKLDLVLRSEHELPASLVQEIRQTAIPALDAIGLVGTIQFQSGRSGWVNIRPSCSAEPENRTI